jgi:excisionase family DNA binding protein
MFGNRIQFWHSIFKPYALYKMNEFVAIPKNEWESFISQLAEMREILMRFTQNLDNSQDQYRPGDILTINQVAAYLKVERKCASKMIEQGSIPSVARGKRRGVIFKELQESLKKV